MEHEAALENIKEKLAKGDYVNDIRQSFLDRGWSQSEIDEVLEKVPEELKHVHKNHDTSSSELNKYISLPGLGSLINETSEQLRSQSVNVTAITGLFFILFAIVLTVYVVVSFLLPNFNIFGISIPSFIALCCFVVIWTWLQTTLINIIARKEQGKLLGIMRRSLRKTPQVFTTYFLNRGLLALITALGVYAATSEFLIPNLGLFTLIIIPITIVPYTLLSIWFLFGEYIVIDEDIAPLDAFLKSREYTKQHKGYILGILIALGVILFGIEIAVYFATQLLGMISVPLASLIITITLNLLSLIVIFEAIPFFTIFFYRIYLHLREKSHNIAFQPTRTTKILCVAGSTIGIILSIPFLLLQLFIYSSALTILMSALTTVRANTTRNTLDTQNATSPQQLQVAPPTTHVYGKPILQP